MLLLPQHQKTIELATTRQETNGPSPLSAVTSPTQENNNTLLSLITFNWPWTPIQLELHIFNFTKIALVYMDECKVEIHTNMAHTFARIHQQLLLFNDLEGTFILTACLNQESITAAYHFVFYTIYTASNSCFRWLPHFLLPLH